MYPPEIPASTCGFININYVLSTSYYALNQRT